MKKIILAIGVFLFFALPASADTCSTRYPANQCVNTANLSSQSGCATGLCSGDATIKCCPVTSVVCKADGSSLMQPCASNGKVGQCNSAGVCIVPENAPNVGVNTVAPPTGSTRTCGPTEFCNPLQFDTVDGFLTHILSYLQRIIVVLALVFVLIGAIMYITSIGDDKQITRAKTTISASLVGLAIGIAAPSFLKEIAILLGWNQVNNAQVAGALTLSEIGLRVVNFLLSTMGILALVMMIVGAMYYLTAAGDEDQIKKGKKIFQYSVFGVIIAMSSMVVIKQVALLLAR